MCMSPFAARLSSSVPPRNRTRAFRVVLPPEKAQTFANCPEYFQCEGGDLNPHGSYPASTSRRWRATEQATSAEFDALASTEARARCWVLGNDPRTAALGCWRARLCSSGPHRRSLQRHATKSARPNQFAAEKVLELIKDSATPTWHSSRQHRFEIAAAPRCSLAEAPKSRDGVEVTVERRDPPYRPLSLQGHEERIVEVQLSGGFGDDVENR